MPLENPKLGAVATTAMNGKDFATLLEKAIQRSEIGKPLRLIEGGKAQVAQVGRDSEDLSR